MGQMETFAFDKGINLKKATLFLENGELTDCEGYSFEHVGILECRDPKTIGEAIPDPVFDLTEPDAGTTTSTDLCNGDYSWFLSGSGTTEYYVVKNKIANGTFDTDLTSWDDTDAGGGVSDWYDGKCRMMSMSALQRASRDQAIVTTAGKLHTLTFQIPIGDHVYLLIGSSSGSADLYPETLFADQKTYTITFTPTGTTSYIRFKVVYYGGAPKMGYVDNVSCEVSDTISLTDPYQLKINGSVATRGDVGSLAAGRWGYGNNDSLSTSTIYVRLSDGTDPDTKAAGYIIHVKMN